MSEFSDGFALAERLIAVERRVAEFESYKVEHELSEGAHAAAFAAHGMSPGVVSDAEETAEAILENAENVVNDGIETIGDVTDEGVETVEDAAEAATEGVTEIGDDTVESVAGATESVIPEGGGEREPANVHPLHRKFNVLGKAS